MAVNIGPLFIDNPLGLAWLGLALLLILLYLIRPKPKTKELPSLMFFMKGSGKQKLLSFFRMFVYDFMLIVQFLLLLLLLLVPSMPFNFTQHDITSSNTVIVIDASASMQTLEDGRSRFKTAVSQSKKHFQGRVGVIVAQDPPYIALKDGSSLQAQNTLSSLNPSESTSRIGDSIILAGELLRGKEGRVIVISDFITTHGSDPNIAKAVLQSRGLVVDFVNVAEDNKNNVGFIDLVVDDSSTTAYIKNYNEDEATVTINVGEETKQVSIPAKGVEPFVFETLPGINEITLSPEDHFPVDNKIYTSAPEDTTIKTLLITNGQTSFLRNAQPSGCF
jgi:hypothetical protein